MKKQDTSIQDKNSEALRQEIIESENAKIDLLKFKLIAIAALGAVGLGFNNSDNKVFEHAELVLCIVPFTAIYFDLMCYHVTIRILVIAEFLSNINDDYEIFLKKNMYNLSKKGRKYFFHLEDFVTHYSSVVISFLLVLYSIIKIKYPSTTTDNAESILSIEYTILTFGLIGVITTFISRKYYRNRIKALDRRMKYKIQNNEIGLLLKYEYKKSEIQNLFDLLEKNNSFYFNKLENGLFPAADLDEKNIYTNYDKVWVRDNIFIAYTHYINGKKNEAIQTVRALGKFFYNHKHRFESIINGTSDPDNPMNRPHIRFNGADLSEAPENWAHAENDALGYYFWFLNRLANEGEITYTEEEKELFPLFILYFKKIEFWQDEDSGHWEETRKIEASSIGPVTKALDEALNYLKKNETDLYLFNDQKVDFTLIENLIEKGKNTLRKILPNECIQKDKLKYREVDAALLFLIYPLDIPKGLLNNEELEDKIIRNVINNLQGDFGIRRYLGDSFWTADTKKKQSQEEITADYSDRIEDRNKNHTLGEEAQWCIFDSILSIIYGIKYQRDKNKKYKELQTHYFNRALSQITGNDCVFGSFKCPEMYYLEDGQYVVNDTVPLLWAQANLWLAFWHMKK